ncbi:MAG: TolC family protein [Bacteroidales bacterium]|nr:TolC family protein [Bacteroidales bacterium]
MKKKIPIVAGFILMSGMMTAQDTLLENYIRMGLESNLALRQKHLSWSKSLEALKEARGMFFPAVSLNARYTVADGGRTISFPVGDILNPVYTTLNALTSGLPPDEQFPAMSIGNEEFQFYRPAEHETKLSLHQPIFSPRVYHGYRIREEMATAAFIDVNIYRRQLVAEIKTAYYNYLKTHYVIELLDQALKVVNENLRVNERLFSNDKVTSDIVDLSRAEVSRVAQQITEAERDQRISATWFNFLLNRPFDAHIEFPGQPEISPVSADMAGALDHALTGREEMDMLDAYTRAHEHTIKMHDLNRLPTLVGAVDYGFQGSEYRFTDEDDFFLGSLVLKWDLFAGRSQQARVTQAEIEKDILSEKRKELEQRISLEVVRAWWDLDAAEKAIESAKMQKQSTASAFRVIEKKYGQGQANLIEFMDARNSMTNAGENLIITLADYMVKYAEFERAAGLYPLDELQNRTTRE